MSVITSSANGTYTDCGLGQGVGLTLTCGSSCGISSQFPHLQCSSTTSCSNSVQCPGTQHPDNTVTGLQIDGQDFQGTNDGHGNVAYSGATTNTSNPSPGHSRTDRGIGGIASGASTGVDTGTATGTGARSPGSSPAPSGTSSPFSKALFVVLGMLIGQSTTDSSKFFRLKDIALNTGVSLLWILVLVPAWTYGQGVCDTLVDFSAVFSSMFSCNILAINARALSFHVPGTAHCRRKLFCSHWRHYHLSLHNVYGGSDRDSYPRGPVSRCTSGGYQLRSYNYNLSISDGCTSATAILGFDFCTGTNLNLN